MDKQLTFYYNNSVELQWLEHGWLLYHGYFELVLKSLTKKKKKTKAADIIVFGIISGDLFLY